VPEPLPVSRIPIALDPLIQARLASADLAAPLLTADVRRVVDEIQFNVGSVGDSIAKMFGRLELPDSGDALLATKSAAIEEAAKAISRSLEPEQWHAFGFPALKDADRFNDVLARSLAAPAWASVTNFHSVLEEMLANKLKCLLQRRHVPDVFDFQPRPSVTILIRLTSRS
jgi:hypothetical protein